jgi:NitT/TauT family transport system substrate-binding protein
MEGRRVGLWSPDSAVDFQAFLKEHNLAVVSIPQSYTVNLFLSGGVEVASATWYNEYHIILNSGVNKEELNLFFLSDYGCDFPQDGIYVLEETIRRDPELCASFTDASIEGWKYAFTHPDEALNVVMNYIRKAHIPASRAHQKWMLEKMKDLVAPDNRYETMGVLSADRYESVAQMLKKQGEVSSISEFSTFYRFRRSHDTK